MHIWTVDLNQKKLYCLAAYLENMKPLQFSQTSGFQRVLHGYTIKNNDHKLDNYMGIIEELEK